ncbi:MAG: hypothetical protein A2672_01160 [Candidatus Wildermuthbacteria bacterium RIFCSPHIGHO2_01_FULL_49_22b]|uniref:Uncharacterized protein n=1 Tax=Candidatus Wildermuthbacteria bacterium RIFCSPHIGHO2_01_FULL_49_22b TaxID=1802448 RepID=A0A1G2R1J2_9BACT|nr:MAG: hypothetical protein A2672_01160 [Candidatus Wildermuthbacteria bacterium RIFCSPHIGHO2_01_FULL_49_22b]
MKELRLIYAGAVSAIVTIIAVTAVTIIAELAQPFKDFLKSLTGHHWITKSWFTITLFVVLFIIIALMVRTPSPGRVGRVLTWLIIVTIIASLALLGFFVWEFTSAV